MARLTAKRELLLSDIKAEPEEEEPPQEQNEANMCMICTKEIVDPANLDTCTHVICFNCMKEWLKQSMQCPTCRAAPKEFILINSGTPNEVMHPVSEIIKEKERQTRERAGNSIPLDQERQVIRRAKAELQLVIDKINQPSNNFSNNYSMRTRTKRQSDSKLSETKNREYAECVSNMNSLNMLLSYTDRARLISSEHFRKLIYKYNLDWTIARTTDDYNRRNLSYTPKYARENYRTEKERLVPFITNELNNVPLVLKGNKKFRSVLQRQLNAEKIFEKLLELNIHAPAFHSFLTRDLKIESKAADRFEHELFHFAASGLQESDYYTVSCYRLHDTGGVPAPNFAIGGLNVQANQEVVTIDDREERDDDIIVEEAIVNHQPESNYVRDEPISSGSERDELYQRRACRLPNINRNVAPFNPGSSIGYSRFPILANQFPSLTNIFSVNNEPQAEGPGVFPRFNLNRPFHLPSVIVRDPPFQTNAAEPVAVVEIDTQNGNTPQEVQRATSPEITEITPPTRKKSRTEIAATNSEASAPSTSRSSQNEASLNEIRRLEKEQDKAYRSRKKNLQKSYDWHKRKLDSYAEEIRANDKDYSRLLEERKRNESSQSLSRR